MNANYVHVIIKHPGDTTQTFKTKLKKSEIDIGDAKIVENDNDSQSSIVHGYQNLIDDIQSKINGIEIIENKTKSKSIRSETPVKARSLYGGNKSNKNKKLKNKKSKSKKRVSKQQ